MSEVERNKQVIRRLLEAADRADLDAIGAFFAPDYLDHSGGGSREAGDREGALAAFRRLAPAFPDLEHTIHDLIAEGDRVVLRVSATATHEAELAGIAPTGRSITMTQTVVYRLRDGLIVERWLESPGSVVEWARKESVAMVGPSVLRGAAPAWQEDASGASFWELALADVALTCFRLPAGTRFAAHAHDAQQITYVLEGELTFEVGTERHTLGSGDAIAIPSGVRHAVWAGSEPVLALDAWSPPPNHLGTDGGSP